jgi:hypothetical protein
MITEEDFKNWLQDPVTMTFRKKLKEDIANYQSMLITIDIDELRMVQAHCQAAIKITEIEWEDLQ